MKFRKSMENKLTSEEILDQASKCKSGELEELLNQIQLKLEQNTANNHDMIY